MTDNPPARPGSPLSPVLIDLAGASLDQYDAILEHLRRHGHYHELRDGWLVVQARHEPEVLRLLDDHRPWSNHRVSPVPTFARRTRSHVDGHGLRVASRSRRIGGFLADAIIALVVAIAARAALDSDRLAYAISWLAVQLAALVPVAAFGWSPGKLVAGTRITIASHPAPGFARATLRWVVPAVPVVAATAAAPASEPLAGLIWWVGTIAVYVGVLFGRDRRGLHDVAAGTTVVRAADVRRSVGAE